MKIQEKRALRSALFFIAPFLILYLIFTIWPIIYGAYVSFFNWGLMGKQKFVGWDNYARLGKDRHFADALMNTLKYVAFITPLNLILALTAALLANRKVFGQKYFRVAFYLPSVLSVAVISYITIYLHQPYQGFVNNILRTLGLIRGADEPMWLRDVNKLWYVLTISTVWWTLGASMMLYLSALQDIPAQVYEAAQIDGATKAQCLFHITLPLLRPTTFLLLLLQIIASFKIFGQVHLISGGGPGTATRPLVLYIYQAGFVKNKLGYASAMSFVLFLIIAVVSAIQLRIQAKGEQA